MTRVLMLRRSRRISLSAAALVGSVLLTALAASHASGADSPGAPEGRWRRARHVPSEKPLSEEQKREIEKLESLAYLTGSKPAPGLSGVTVHDVRSASQGYNFYTSGHFPGAVLMDMQGNVLHTWKCEFVKAFPGEAAQAANDGAKYWHCAHLCRNGDVIAVFDGLGIARVDRDSKVLWATFNRAHHDVDVQADGRIFTLTREGRAVPGIGTSGTVLDDYVVVLDSRGKETARVSMLDAFLGSDYESLIRSRGPNKLVGDVLHANAVDVLDGSLAASLPAFKKGNVLVSSREFDALAVVDMTKGKVVWATGGTWRAQHDSEQLPDGSILLFDNKGGKGASRVLEYDPVSGGIRWSYQGDAANPFYSELCGTADRLPNGNTLVTESDFGRAFEVTRDGRLVWEFLNPERAGQNGDLIATIFEMRRLPPDFPLDWLQKH